MKRKLLILALVATALCTTLSAQEYSDYYDLSESKNQPIQFGLNIRAVTVFPSLGIEFATKFSPKLTLRAGMDFMQYSRSETKLNLNRFSAMDDFLKGIKSEVGYRPNINIKGKYHTLMGHAIVDYHPFAQSSSFFVSAGFYFGKTNINAQAMMTNPHNGESFTKDLKNLQDMPELEITDTNGKSYTIRPTDEGEVKVDALFGNGIKPYIGIGFGQSVPKGRVGAKIELGTYYSGKVKLETPNFTEGNVNDLVLIGQDYGPKVIYWTRWVPVLNVGLTIRL